MKTFAFVGHSHELWAFLGNCSWYISVASSMVKKTFLLSLFRRNSGRIYLKLFNGFSVESFPLTSMDFNICKQAVDLQTFRLPTLSNLKIFLLAETSLGKSTTHHRRILTFFPTQHRASMKFWTNKISNPAAYVGSFPRTLISFRSTNGDGKPRWRSAVWSQGAS